VSLVPDVSEIPVNGDDAFTVNNGATNVTVRNAMIGGPGTHGCSVGSLGQDQTIFYTVSNSTENFLNSKILVLFDSISVVNGVYGARFKSYVGGQGLAKNVTWSNFFVTNVTFPVYVTQNYFKQVNEASLRIVKEVSRPRMVPDPKQPRAAMVVG
jgi:hypothetical protein